MPPKRFWTYMVLVSFFLVLAVASKKGGKSKGGGWNTGSNRNPSNPGNTGSNWNPGNTGSNWNPGGSNYNPGSNYNNKPWKPPKSKPNMKMVAGAAAVGAVGGFMLGNAVSNMQYRFDNDRDYRYYNSYQNQMPSRVYKPMYQDDAYVTEDRFVTDCYNMSMTEYVIKPNDGKNSSDVDQTEVRVKSSVIRQLCVTEFRRGNQYRNGYGGFGVRLLVSPSLIFFITLFVYFVVQ